MRSAWKKLLQAGLGRLGYRLVPWPTPTPGVPPSPLERFFAFLKRQGFQPEHILDVGAHTGTWTRQALRFFPEAQYTLIEPQGHLQTHIQDLLDTGYKIDWLPLGVADRPGVRYLTVQARSDSSSFLPARRAPGEPGPPQIPVEVHTLNDVLYQRNLPMPNLLKIDAEGLDLRVLAGASKVLGQTEVILIEASVVARNPENTAEAVFATLTDAGYRLVDITDLNRSPRDDALWLCEFAFLLRTSRLLEGVTQYD